MHDLFGAGIAQARPFIVNVHAVVIVRGAVEAQEVSFADD